MATRDPRSDDPTPPDDRPGCDTTSDGATPRTIPQSPLPVEALPEAEEGGGALHRLKALRSVQGRTALPSEDVPRDALVEDGGGRRYSPVGEIGRGGMGAIVKIVDHDIRRPVAMKIVLDDTDAARLERFVKEAQITGQLEHPNIVPVHELGVDRRGKTYFTMKLVKGETLHNRVERLGREENALTELLDVFLKVCDAVAFAHSKGVVHRDLKPENVMVGRFGEVMVMDWGLAKILNADGDVPSSEFRVTGSGPAPEQLETPNSEPVTSSPRTLEGDVVGTPAYMPPEQAAGRVDDIDARSDVFALGGILYKILTHEDPYDGQDLVAVLDAAVRRALVPPHQRTPWAPIPVELGSVCMKAMAAAPQARYESVQELSQDIRAFLERRPVSAHRYSPLTQFVRFVQRHPAGSLAGGVASFLLAVGLALGSVMWARMQADAARANEQTLRAQMEKARAEAETLRAEKAERDRDAFQARAVEAEDSVRKGRAVAKLFLAAKQYLNGPMARMKRARFSPGTMEERFGRALADHEKALAFESRVPADKASQAAWFALRGWLGFLAANRDEVKTQFEKARKTDPDVIYGYLFEAMAWLTLYLKKQALPPIRLGEGGLHLGAMPSEPAELAEVRRKFTTYLEQARQASTWGESAAQDVNAVLDGLFTMREGGYDRAEEGLSRALTLPEMVWMREELLLARAKVRYLQFRFEDGIHDIETFLETIPDSVEALEFLGQLYMGAGAEQTRQRQDPQKTYERAIEAFDRGLRLSPGDGSLHMLRGSTYSLVGQQMAKRGLDPSEFYQRSLADFDIAVANPDGYQTVYRNRSFAGRLLGEWKLYQKDHHGALEVLLKAFADGERAVADHPDSPESLMHRGMAATRLAHAKLACGQDPGDLLDRALADYARVSEMISVNAELLSNKAGALATLAKLEQARGRDSVPYLEEAIGLYSEMLRLSPGDTDALYNRGTTYNDMALLKINAGKDATPILDKAIADLTAVVQAEPERIAAYNQAALAFRRKSRVEKALGLDARESLGQAVALLEEALERAPDNLDSLSISGPILFDLAVAKAGAGQLATPDLEAALERIEKALTVSAEKWKLIFTRGNCQELLGQFNEAAESYEQILKVGEANGLKLSGGIAELKQIAAYPDWRLAFERGKAAVKRHDYTAIRTHFEDCLEKARARKLLDDPKSVQVFAPVYFTLARVEALASEGKRGPWDDNPAVLTADQATQHRAKAISHLRAILDKGFDIRKQIRSTEDLAPLKGDPDFEKLISEFGKK